MKAKSTYEIEQYELHTMKYRVEAATEAEAIAKLFDGEGEAVRQQSGIYRGRRRLRFACR